MLFDTPCLLLWAPLACAPLLFPRGSLCGMGGSVVWLGAGVLGLLWQQLRHWAWTLSGRQWAGRQAGTLLVGVVALLRIPWPCCWGCTATLLGRGGAFTLLGHQQLLAIEQGMGLCGVVWLGDVAPTLGQTLQHGWVRTVRCGDMEAKGSHVSQEGRSMTCNNMTKKIRENEEGKEKTNSTVGQRGVAWPDDMPPTPGQGVTVLHIMAMWWPVTRGCTSALV